MGSRLLAYVDGNAAKNQDSGDTYSRWYALNSGGTLIGSVDDVPQGR